MNLIFQEIKFRVNALNIIRLILSIALIGEALHSEAIWPLAIALVFLVQLVLNKKCGSESCQR